ncbi:hypothetical protein P7K49_016683 [Saguinus oedipus]|uniref:Gamma-glutamylaminecyclotransferase n=1 Tax=Saguinus oedipus TaxID=9490 RepID=A0ABQ9VE41_SAGOE|nr:hypothetical protein P7K49_016683 [Saguinus oedipus]
MRGCTLEPYSLVIAGKHSIPWLLHLPGLGRRVEGEVYAYQRTALRVQLLEDQAPGTEKPPAPTEAQCFVYSTATFPLEWAQLLHRDSHDSEGPHRLRYQPPGEQMSGENMVGLGLRAPGLRDAPSQAHDG